MIRCTAYRNPFDARSEETWLEPWGPDVTPESCCPPYLKGSPGLVCLRNGAEVSGDAMHASCANGDFLEYAIRPGFATFTAVLFGFELFSFSAPLLLVKAGAAIVNSLVAAAAISAINGNKKKQPTADQREESPAYSFGGVGSNPDYEGAPYPAVYGQYPVAGVVLNRFTRSIPSPPASTYHVLLCLAGHEVEAIGDKTSDGGPFTTEDGNLPEGLLIDNQPAANFSNVEVHVRMGSSNQAPIGGHSSPTIQYAIERLLPEPRDTAPSPSGQIEATPGTYAAGASEITKWESPVAFTMGEPADAFIADLNFPLGLYKLVQSTGARTTTSVEVQARYRRVDENGDPFGQYVVLPKFGTLTAATGVPFSYEVGATFYDPASYGTTTAGDSLSFDGTNDYASVSSPSGISAANDMCAAMWVRVEWNVDSGSGTFVSPYKLSLANSTMVLVDQLSGNSGFQLRLDDTTVYPARSWSAGVGYYSAPRVRLEVELGDGSSTETFSHDTWYITGPLLPDSAPSGSSTLLGKWALVAFTYAEDAPNAPTATPNEVRFFMNGDAAGSAQFTASDHEWANTADIYVGATSTPSNYFAGYMDELLLYQRAVSQIELRALWNGGQGMPGIATSSNIVAGWHFDSLSGTTPDFVGSNDLTVSGATLAGEGVMEIAGGTATLRGRYLIEFQRLSETENVTLAQDQVDLLNIKLVSQYEFSRPGLALMSVMVRADAQLSGGPPSVLVPVKGAKCPVWDGQDEDAPVTADTYTQNPAWQIVDASRNTTHGLGRFVKGVDWNAFKDAADYFDSLVWDFTRSLDSSGDEMNGVKQLTFYAVDAASAGGSWPTGYYEMNVAEADLPKGWPGNQGVIAKADATEWFQVVEPAAGAPQWVKDIANTPMPVGEVSHVTAIYVGGNPVPTSVARWIIRVHAPYDPASASYTTTTEDTLVQRMEPRMQFDGVFDRTDLSGWDAVQAIARSARAVVSVRGGLLTIFVDRARSVSRMVTSGNSKKGAFSMTYGSAKPRTNQIDARYFDRQKNWEPTPLTESHSELSSPSTNVPVRAEEIQLEGITRRSQVIRHLRHELNRNHLSRRSMQDVLGPDSLGMMPFEVVAVASPLPQWGFSGLLMLNSPAADRVYLDQSVTIASGSNYEITWRSSRTGAEEVLPVNESATGGNGTYAPGRPIYVTGEFSEVPQRDDAYSFGATGKSTRKFQVVGNSWDAKNHERAIVAIEYNEDIYDPTGFADYPASPTALDPPTFDSLPT